MNRIDLGGRIALVTAARGIGRAIAERFSASAADGGAPIGRFFLVEEIAALILWLASEECSFLDRRRPRHLRRPGRLTRYGDPQGPHRIR